jgi:hypothetical protein
MGTSHAECTLLSTALRPRTCPSGKGETRLSGSRCDSAIGRVAMYISGLTSWGGRVASEAKDIAVIRPLIQPAIDPAQYAASLFPHTMLKQCTVRDEAANAPTPNHGPAPLLSLSRYAERFLPLLATEHTARIEDLRSATLYSVPLTRDVGFAESSGIALYRVEAKSIREGWPPVDISDIVNLVQLRPESNSSQGIAFECEICPSLPLRRWAIFRFFF